MNGITHKQAMKLIHRQMDGMLKGNETLLLDDHLSSCASCRAYANELSSLPAQLTSEFKGRWNTHQEPSPRILQHVTGQARKIPMQQRFASGVKLVTGITVIAILALTMNFIISQLQSAATTTDIPNGTPSAYLGESIRLLAFTMEVDGNLDIFTIRADGSGLTNLTRDPARDVSPIFSPDGKHIAFESDRTGATQIYLMDADGANLVQLTDDQAEHKLSFLGDSRLNSWSPDGSKLLFVQTDPQTRTNDLYAINIASRDRSLLASDTRSLDTESWSPNGEYIGYIVWDEVGTNAIRPNIHIVDAAGNTPRELSKFLPQDEHIFVPYFWASDGRSIIFTGSVYEESRMTVYQFDPQVDALTPLMLTKPILYDWHEGVALGIGEAGGQTFFWQLPDGTTTELDTMKGADPADCYVGKARAASGNLILGSSCVTNNKVSLYWTNADGSNIQPLPEISAPSLQGGLVGLTLSPDEKFIAFNFESREETSLYLWDLEAVLKDPSVAPQKILIGTGDIPFISSWQPVMTREDQLVDEKPTPEPTKTIQSENLPNIGTNISNGEWIAFLGTETVVDPQNLQLSSDLYVLHPDGSGLTNVTQSPAHYYNLQWSPNGQNLLAIRENPSDHKINFIRIYEGAVGGGGDFARPFSDPDMYGYSWSPNSDKIVFADASHGNYDIYTVYADGSNDPKLTQLTDDPAQDVGFAWSPDGSQIAFQRMDGNKLFIYVMNEDGSEPRKVAQGSGKVNLYWSHNGTSIYASSTENNWIDCEGCVHKPAIYRIDLESTSTHQLYYEPDASNVFWYLYEAPSNTLYFMRIDPPQFVELWGTWFQANGDSVSALGEMDPHQTCKTTTGNTLSEYPSPNQRFSLIANFCVGNFDLYLADRATAEAKSTPVHLLRLPAGTEGQGGNNDTLPLTWSPDGRYIVYDNVGTYYLLNIEQAMQDPQTKPIKLLNLETLDFKVLFDFTWQPKP